MSDTDATKQPELPAMGFAADLNGEERTLLSSFGEFITANDGDMIINEGEEQNSLFLIVFGNFHVQTDTTGRTVLLGQLKSGDSVGEINIFDPGDASASVVARSLSQVWKIDRSRLEQFLETHPARGRTAPGLCRDPVEQAAAKNQRESRDGPRGDAGFLLSS